MTNTMPSTIGGYRVLRPIARGGMAEVYQVEDPVSGEHLALKLLVQTGGALPRFNREYEAMIRLNHPNIVRVYHYGLHGDLPWLTMELIDGTPVQAYAKRCGRAGTERRTKEVIRVAHDLALALDHIHHRGLVHRDLKSANVLVLPDGRVKLIDFGTARVSDAVEAITREGEFIGTFAYASPEQLTQRPVDKRSDLYSLGVLLYRMATGKRPFNAKDLHALARQHVKEKPRPPRELVPVLPEGLERLILQLLEKKPENRPESGLKVAEALEEVAGHPLVITGHLDVDLSGDSLVGREEQMSRLWRFIDETEALRSPPGEMALVTGPPGSGRRRAMEAVERDVRKRGWRVLTWFFHRDGDPLDSLTTMLTEATRSFAGGGPGSHSALPRMGQLPVAAAERIDALARAGEALLTYRARTDEKPMLILMRSVHNAGPVGLEAMVQLQNRLRRSTAPIVLMGDLVESETDPDSPARNRLGKSVRVHMPPMGVRQVALLVGSLLHRRPPPGVVARRIYDASGGLPSYVEAVVRGMVSRGLLRVQGRDANRIEWALQQNMEIPVPDVARQRVMEQLAQLPADRRRTLEALALLDGEGSPTVLAAAIGCTTRELLPALEDLDRRGWISLEARHGAPYARWQQILAERVVLEQLHPCRRRVLERKLIEQIADQPAFAAQIRLLLQVGRHADALARALDWSLHHISKHRPETTLRVLDQVMPYVKDAPIEKTDKARLYLLHVTALLMARPTDPNTSRSLALATELGRAEGDHFEAELHLLRARIQRVIGHYPNFRKHLMEAWYLVEHTHASSLAANVAGLLGWSNRAAGAVEAAATWHGRSRRIAVQVGVPGVRAHADVGVAGWQFARGLLNESERTAASAIAIFGEVGDLHGLSLAVPIWASSLRQQGRFSEVLATLSAQAPAVRECEAPSLYVRLLLATAWAEVDVCRLGRAQECVDELGATLRKGEHLDLRLQAELVWGRILLASGQLREARHRLQQVRDRAQNAGLIIIAQSAHALLGEVLASTGDPRAAARAFEVSVDALVRSGHVPAAAAACSAHARALGHLMDPDQIFAPVADYVDEQPCTTVRLERTLAKARHAVHQGKDQGREAAAAAKTLNQIVNGLDETDRAAIHLHPWSREVRMTGVA